jgi:hypothetical protein
MKESKILNAIYGDSWKKKDWSGIIGMTILLFLILVPVFALPWIWFFNLLQK